MGDTRELDPAGLRGAIFVLELEGDWRFLDRDADRAGEAVDLFADYDARAFLSSDVAAAARDVAGHVLHYLLVEAVGYRWLDWCEQYPDRQARATRAAGALLTSDAADVGRATAILDAAFGPATRSAADDDLAQLPLPQASAVATAVRGAHAEALSAPPMRSTWLIDRLAVAYARAVADYHVPGHDRYAAMYELAERMADSYEGALALGLPPEWAMEAAQLVNWIDDLLASPSGYTMQIYQYADTELRDHAEELAVSALRVYLAARAAGRSRDEGEADALTAFRATLARYGDADDEEEGQDDAARETPLVRRLITVYERVTGGAMLPAPPMSRHPNNPLLDVVQGVTGYYRVLREYAASQSGPEEDKS